MTHHSRTESLYNTKSKSRSDSGVVVGGKPMSGSSALSFWALMSFTFVSLIMPQAYIRALAPLRLALLSGGVALAAYILSQFAQRKPIMRLTGEMKTVGVLIGWAVLTLPLSLWPGRSVSVLTDSYLKALAVFWLIANVVDTSSRLRQIAWVLSLIAVPLAASGVKNYLSGEFVLVGEDVNRISGYSSPLARNPNDLALILCLILPLVIALTQCARRPVVRISLFGIAVLLIAGVVVTFSRSGFITLMVVLILYEWKLFQRRRSWAMGVLIVVLLSIPLLPLDYRARIASIQRGAAADAIGSSQARWAGMVAAMNFVVRHPIVGAGLGTDILALNEEFEARQRRDGAPPHPMWRRVHNVYLQYAVDLGIPGLILYLVLMISCIKSAALVRERSAGIPALRGLFYLAEGIHVSLIAFACAAMFYPVAYHLYFYYFAGLAIALRGTYNTEVANAQLMAHK